MVSIIPDTFEAFCKKEGIKQPDDLDRWIYEQRGAWRDIIRRAYQKGYQEGLAKGRRLGKGDL